MHPNLCLFPFFSVFVDKKISNNKNYGLKPCAFISHCPSNETTIDLIKDYNSEFYRNLRELHYNGNGLTHPSCIECKKMEDVSLQSARQANNIHFMNQINADWQKEIEEIKNQNFFVTVSNIHSIDYMPSNYCNYACIMCNAGASSRWNHILTLLNQETDQVHFSLNENIVNLNNVLENAQLINFTGGETLLQPEVRQFVDALINSNNTKKKVSILTNVSQYDADIYSKLEKFDNCFMTFSIDGVGKIIEYQRQFSKWKNVEENFQQIRKNHPKIAYVINYVVSSVSAIGLADFLLWAYENRVQDVKFSYVHDYDYWNVDSLQPEIIQREISRIESLDFSKIENLSNFPNVVSDALKILKGSRYNPNYTLQMVNRAKQLDSVRSDGMKLTDILPELLELYNE